MAQRYGMIAGVAAALCVAGGAMAGLDAGRTVDSFYTTSREPLYQPIPDLTKPATPWEWDNRPVAAAPPPGTIWGQEVGADERAFFDTEPAEEWKPEPVRVFRASIESPPAEPVPATQPVDVGEPDDPVDGWVDPPAVETNGEPVPQPVLG